MLQGKAIEKISINSFTRFDFNRNLPETGQIVNPIYNLSNFSIIKPLSYRFICPEPFSLYLENTIGMKFLPGTFSTNDQSSKCHTKKSPVKK